MFKNYLKLAIRNIARNKVYSFISIIGLAFGICCSLFIMLYTFDELSYNQFHEKKDRIYRMTELIDHNGEINAALSSFPVGPTYTADYPEIQNFVRFLRMGNTLTIRVEEKIFREQNFWLTDSTIFDVFSFRLLHGDPKLALTAPRTMVLTEDLAVKYFGAADVAMGKQIQVGNTTYDITGVVENSPGNSDINFSALGSLTSIPQPSRDAFNQDWFRLVCHTFLLFDKPIDVADFRGKMDEFAERYVDPYVESFGGESSAAFFLQPLPSLHFDNSREYDLPKGNINFIYIFILLAVFILLIACINYINLSLSQSIKRAKEVGVRKTLGAYRGQIARQFLGESVLITLIALILGLGLVEVLLSLFNDITGKSFEFGAIFNLKMILGLLLILISVGLISGLYPALVLSNFEASNILRGNLPKIGRFGNLRRVLMLVQFIFSLFMIIGTISIFMQMNYMQNKELGFDRDQLVVINIPQDTAVYNKLTSFKEELLQNPVVKGVTGSGGIPGNNVGELMFRIEQEGQMIDKNIKFLAADEDFFDLLGIEVLAGRNFSSDIQSDIQQAFIINETAARKFGWGDEALEKRMQWGLMPDGQAQSDGKVVGVVKDFHFASLHNPMEPLAVLFRPNFSGLFSVKLQGGEISESLAFLEDKWGEFAGNHPFEYQFLDDRIDQQYQAEQTLLSVFTFFAIISIVIAALGLFALTSFTVEQRMKEISIRKVLGASTSNLSALISKEFLILLGLAVLIISPVSYFAIDYWLEGFTYKISIPVGSFFAAAAVSLVITMMTISYHIFTITRTNPARTLRTE